MVTNTVKPDFLIIGAAKAATTTLSNMLALHPQAGIVKGKEPHFFSTDRYVTLGWAQYQQLYSHCADKLIAGDASTSYSRLRYNPDTIQRIQKHVPNVKIIYMVRHPLKRMESAYVERLASPTLNEQHGSINQAVKQQPMIIDSSRYWEVFDAYRQAFGEDNIKIVWFEEFIKQPDEVFADVCRFLGIDDQIKVDLNSIKQNTRNDALNRVDNLGRGEMKIQTEWSKKTKQWVIEQIRDDTIQFLAHFGKPKNFWGDDFKKKK